MLFGYIGVLMTTIQMYEHDILCQINFCVHLPSGKTPDFQVKIAYSYLNK
jgi:hypothetical protein